MLTQDDYARALSVKSQEHSSACARLLDAERDYAKLLEEVDVVLQRDAAAKRGEMSRGELVDRRMSVCDARSGLEATLEDYVDTNIESTLFIVLRWQF